MFLMFLTIYKMESKINWNSMQYQISSIKEGNKRNILSQHGTWSENSWINAILMFIFLPFVFIFSRRKITKKALVLVSFFRSLNNKVLRSSWINIYANFHLNWINGTARLWFMSIFMFDLAGKCVNIVPYLYVHALRLLKFIFFIFSSS